MSPTIPFPDFRPNTITPEYLADYLGNLAAFSHQYRTMKPWPARNPITRVLQPLTAEGDRTFPAWADHQVYDRSNPYRPAYICHPYHLDSQAWADFQRLESAGLRVRVAGHSEYYPAAVRVSIEERSRG